ACLDRSALPRYIAIPECIDGGRFCAGIVGEKRPQAVVVRLKNRIELVVVAARTAESQGEEHGARRCGDFLEGFPTRPQQTGSGGLVDPMPVESHTGERFRIARIQLVAGDLLTHETVVRLVVIERLDDVVAITPDGETRGVGGDAVAVCVMRNIEPIAAPPL